MKLKAVSDAWNVDTGEILVREGKVYEGQFLLEDGELVAVVFGDTRVWSTVCRYHFEPADHGKK